MPSHTPKQITAIVDKMEMDRQALHARMDTDMGRYDLEPYKGELDAQGVDTLADYKKFTANDPQTVMNLALHLMSTAKRIIRVHQPRAQNEEREVNNIKELFELGILAAADEGRQNILMPALMDSMGSQSLFRGRIAQRVLLVKEPIMDQVPPEILEQLEQSPELLEQLIAQGVIPTSTHVEIVDWDPRNVYLGMGRKGIAWACEKSFKSRNDIIEEYGVDPKDTLDDPSELSEDDYTQEFAVYDWMDDQTNQVIIESHEELKAKTPHGMGRVPLAFAYADLRPRFQAGKEQNYETHYGESLYKADRGVFDEQNFGLSILKELSHRSIAQGLVLKSRDGSLTMEKGDPRVAGQEVSLSTSNDEEILPMPPMEVAKEMFPFLQAITGMVQRGTFPASAFGQLSFELSGFAITQLAQDLLAPLTPHIKAVQSATKQILDILSDAYATGQFDQMTLSGRLQDPARSYFSEEISPELVKSGGNIEVEIVAQLPKDDTTRVTLAQMLRDNSSGMPIADDRFIRNMLEFQDPEQMERAVWEQLARQGTPLAIAWNSYLASVEQGDEDQAAIYWNEFMVLAMTKYLEMIQLATITGGQTGLGGPGGGASANGGSGAGAVPEAQTTPGPSVAPPETRGIQSAPNNGFV